MILPRAAKANHFPLPRSTRMTKPLARVLVVEDEPLLAQSIQVALGWRRVEAEHCGTAERRSPS